jgi:hypothetical protein
MPKSLPKSDRRNPALWSGLDRAKLYQYFNRLGYKIGAEIGVQRGRNAKVIFENMPGLEKLILVDPYQDHSSARTVLGAKKHAKFSKQAHDKLSDHNVLWLEDFSEKAAHLVSDNSLDFVYIDGEHTYDFVMIDLILWHRKVRVGGIIAGHDYDPKKWKQFRVTRAVNNWVSFLGSSVGPLCITDKSVRNNSGDARTSFFFEKKKKDLPIQ